MATMSDRELEQIIRRDKPGFKVVQREVSSLGNADAPAGAMMGGANRIRDLPDLRKRYLGIDDEAVEDAEPGEGEGGGGAGDEIVVLAPQQPASDPWRPGPGPKSVVVSGSERRVIAEQG